MLRVNRRIPMGILQRNECRACRLAVGFNHGAGRLKSHTKKGKTSGGADNSPAPQFLPPIKLFPERNILRFRPPTCQNKKCEFPPPISTPEISISNLKFQ